MGREPRRGDVPAPMAFYAPLQVYDLERDVPADRVPADRARRFEGLA